MLLDTLIESLFQPGCVLHLHVQISPLFPLLPALSWLLESHRGLTLPHPGLRVFRLQAGLQSRPQDLHHLLDGAGGVGERLGVVDHAAQQTSVEVDVVLLQDSHGLLHPHLVWPRRHLHHVVGQQVDVDDLPGQAVLEVPHQAGVLHHHGQTESVLAGSLSSAVLRLVVRGVRTQTQVLDLVRAESLPLLPPGLQEPHQVLVVGAPHEPLVPELGVQLLHTRGERDPEPAHHLVDYSGVQHSVSAQVRLPHLHQEDVESPASDSVQP